MQSLHAEWKKHRTFREAWVGYLLGFAFLLLSLYMQRGEQEWWDAISSSIYSWQGWVVIQQDIYTYGATLTAFLIVIGLSRLLYCEQDCKVDCLLRTTKNGLADSYKAKIILTVQYCAVVVAVIGTLSIAVNGSWFGYADASAQMTKGVYFEQAPVSNLLYCVVQYIFLFLGALYLAGFVLLIASLIKRSAFVIFISGGCFIASLGYYYVGHSWIGGTWFDTICAFLFHYGFSGFMLQESFSRLSATSDIGWRCMGNWSFIWRPILFVLIMIIIEFAVTWALWRRKERR